MRMSLCKIRKAYCEKDFTQEEESKLRESPCARLGKHVVRKALLKKRKVNCGKVLVQDKVHRLKAASEVNCQEEWCIELVAEKL